MLSRAQPGSGPESSNPLARFCIAGIECAVVLVDTGCPLPVDDALGSFTVGGRAYAIVGISEDLLDADPVEILTPRELEIALLVAAGYQTKEIAQRLRISFHTVRVHVGRIYAKLRLHKQTELAACIGARFGYGHPP